jgi:hypothetical protein
MCGCNSLVQRPASVSCPKRALTCPSNNFTAYMPQEANASHRSYQAEHPQFHVNITLVPGLQFFFRVLWFFLSVFQFRLTVLRNVLKHSLKYGSLHLWEGKFVRFGEIWQARPPDVQSCRCKPPGKADGNSLRLSPSIQFPSITEDDLIRSRLTGNRLPSLLINTTCTLHRRAQQSCTAGQKRSP